MITEGPHGDFKVMLLSPGELTSNLNSTRFLSFPSPWEHHTDFRHEDGDIFEGIPLAGTLVIGSKLRLAIS